MVLIIIVPVFKSFQIVGHRLALGLCEAGHLLSVVGFQEIRRVYTTKNCFGERGGGGGPTETVLGL